MQRIFIIDDSQIFRFTVKKLFSLVKFEGEVLEFENGRLAFDYLKAHEDWPETWPDLILLDLNMPVMNGFEFLNAIHGEKTGLSGLKVHVLSSSIDPVDLKDAGVFPQVKGFISKPLTPALVSNLLHTL
ncbi:MAG: response regulator [Bacteroidetes bacterium]|jgi:CheY-like chemotaxis protein|nr:response regulator [Bacteroidota bacterium]